MIYYFINHNLDKESIVKIDLKNYKFIAYDKNGKLTRNEILNSGLKNLQEGVKRGWATSLGQYESEDNPVEVLYL